MTLEEKKKYWREAHPLDVNVDEIIETLEVENDSLRLVIDELEQKASMYKGVYTKLMHVSCSSCRLKEADGQACSILTHAVLKCDEMPVFFVCKKHQFFLRVSP